MPNQSKLITAFAVCLVLPIKKIVIAVQARIPFILKEKLSRSRRKEEFWKNIGLCYLAKNFIVTFYLLTVLAYKNQGDTKHKDMQSLVGVHLKNE